MGLSFLFYSKLVVLKKNDNMAVLHLCSLVYLPMVEGGGPQPEAPKAALTGSGLGYLLKRCVTLFNLFLFFLLPNLISYPQNISRGIPSIN